MLLFVVLVLVHGRHTVMCLLSARGRVKSSSFHICINRYLPYKITPISVLHKLCIVRTAALYILYNGCYIHGIAYGLKCAIKVSIWTSTDLFDVSNMEDRGIDAGECQIKALVLAFGFVLFEMSIVEIGKWLLKWYCDWVWYQIKVLAGSTMKWFMSLYIYC